MAKPPQIRPQVCSAEIMSNIFKPVFTKIRMKYLRICGSFLFAKTETNCKSTNRKKIVSANFYIRRRSAKPRTFGVSAVLRICDLRNLLTDRQPLIQSRAIMKAARRSRYTCKQNPITLLLHVVTGFEKG